MYSKLRQSVNVNRQTLPICLLALMVFVVVTTEFSIVGLLPAMAQDLGVSLAEVGGFVTWFALAAAVIGPPLAIIGGRCEPRIFLLIVSAIFVMGNLAITLLPDYRFITAIRLLQGSTIPAAVSVISVMASNISGAGKENKAISQTNIGVVVATVLGVPVGAILADKFGWSMSFAVLAAMGMISTALIFTYLPRIGKTQSPPSLLTEVSLLWQPTFLLHLLLSLLLFTGMFTGYTYISPLLSTITQLGGEEIGWILMGFGIAGVVGNWLSGQFMGDRPLIATLYIAIILAISMFTVTPLTKVTPLLLVVILAFWGAAHMAAFVVTQVRLMHAGSKAKTFALSLNLSVSNLGIALGAKLGGMMETNYGSETVGYSGAIITMATITLTCIVVMLEKGDRGYRSVKLG